MPRAKLTYEQALEAQEMYKQHIPQRAIAEKYGVSRGAISELVRGNTWGLRSISRGKAKGEDNSAKLTGANVRAIRRLYAKGGITQKALAEKFGVRQKQVSFIVRRLKWAHI